MAIVTVKETWRGQDGERKDGMRRYVRVFNVTVDSVDDTPGDVASDSSVPQYGETYPDDSSAFCRGTVINRSDATWRLYVVQAVYEAGARGLSIMPTNNPLLRMPEISGGSWDFAQPLSKDLLGNSVVNSADSPLDPPVTRNRTYPALRILKNYASWDLATSAAVADTLNAILFWGAPPGTAYMRSPTWEKVYEFGVPYFRVSFEILFRPPYSAAEIAEAKTATGFASYDLSAWDEQRLDAGYSWINTGDSDPETRRVTLKPDGTPYTEPVLLNGSGSPSTTEHYRYFKLYERKDWTYLGLPTS